MNIIPARQIQQNKFFEPVTLGEKKTKLNLKQYP